jgi:hypothetical protein
MKTSYIVGGIVVLLLLILFSVKYVVADKYTLREMLNATKIETVTKSELPSQSGLSQNFTYSIWLYVNNWNYKNGEYKPIFGRFDGGDATQKILTSYFEGINSCMTRPSIDSDCSFNPSPVVTFDKVQNNILVYIPNSYRDDITDKTYTNPFKCEVRNIPIQKWVNFSMTVYNKTLDVYINGKLHKTCVMNSVPVMSSEDIHITPGGGFDGYTSKFQFYPEALNPQEIWNIYSNGYGSLASTLGDYQVKMSLIENGNETNSLTI